MALDPRIALQAQGLNLEPRSNALARGMQLQGAQQQNALRQMQIDQIKAAAQQQIAEREAAAMRQQQMDAALRGLQPVSGINANRASGIAGPRPEAAAAIGQRPQADPIALLRAGFDPKMVEFIVNSPNLGRPEVARVLEQAGAGGRPESVQLDKFGQPVGQALPKAVEAKLMDLGGTKQAYDPYGLKPGQNFQTTMTPEGRDASARGWAGVRQAGERLAFDKSKEGPAAKPSAAQERADIDKQKAGRQGEQMISAIESAKSLLNDGPTQSGVGSLIDAGGRMLGMSSDSAQKAAQLETLSGWMVANVPRMEGPQSNFDIQNYQTMAAKVGDRSVPVSERKAALGTLEALHRKYAEINGTPLPEKPQTPRAATFDADKEQRYQEWKRKQGGGQ